MKRFFFCLVVLLAAMAVTTMSVLADTTSSTMVLVNQSVLQKQYPQQFMSLLGSASAFARAHGGNVIDVSTDRTSRNIKTRLVQYPQHPGQLVIFGDEKGIPRFKVHARDISVETDYFYGDLDGDGLAEVPVTRVIGSPQSMIRQLGALPSARGSQALLLNASSALQHMELNRFASLLSDRGYSIEVKGRQDLQALRRANFIFWGGHGDPDGWAGATDGAYVTADTVPNLPKNPIVFAGGCSTTPPDAPILRSFLERGCQVYIGAASSSFGCTPADLANELILHMIDACADHPDWTIAKLFAEARKRYIIGNQLAPALCSLEKGKGWSSDVSTSALTTALQYQIFGDITATLSRGTAAPAFKKQLLVAGPSHVMMPAGASLPLRFSIGPNDGSPVLFFHAEWDNAATPNLEIDIVQNGKILHSVDWKKQRDWSEFVFITAGGYCNNGRYHAYGLFPLIRQDGMNEIQVVLKHASQPILLQPDSLVQIWTKQYPVVLSSRGISKVVDIFATESSWLGQLGGYNDDHGANLSGRQNCLAWARTQPIESVANNLIDKYLLQFDHQMQLSKDAGDQFYGQASARLASYRIDLGDPGANLLTPEPHTEWARDQSAEELRDTLRTKVRFLMAGAVIGTSE